MFNDNKPTVLALSNSDTKVTIELPWDAGMEELCQAFYSAAIGITFMPETVLEGMRQFSEENLEIYESKTEEEL